MCILMYSVPWSIGCAALDPPSWSRFLLLPWGPSELTPEAHDLAFEEVQIASANGNLLSGWYVPAQPGPARATFIVHTSMQGNLQRYLPLIPHTARRGFNLLVYDWQGFGASEGIPDFRNFEPDTHAALNYLRGRSEPSCHKIIHTGISLGCIPATAISTEATEESIGLVLYGPFYPERVPPVWLGDHMSILLAPLGGVAGDIWAALLPPFMRPQNFVGQVTVPTLVVTPEDDDIVPPSVQAEYFEALGTSTKEQYNTFGGHTHALDADPGFFDAIVGWAEQLPGLLPAE